ncbi:MAG: hypothetical protein ABSC48_09415 [Terracidiphilus sp.]|jgi:hypothetical protein
MRLLRSARWLLLALVITLIPVSSQAGVFISVNFGPPALPVYVQPPCPEPDLMWIPGHWYYNQVAGDYFWVPGTWVAAPAPGLLWTPGYWGWSNGLYLWHEGYWGHHIGYYGGVNYGFGYGGIGFAGGEWRGGHFAYNTAVVHVNETIIHTTYVDRTIVERTTIVNPGHVAYAGGPGGVNHPPTAEERVAEHEQHVAPTPVQQQHIEAAKADKTAYGKANGGHPQNVAVTKAMAPGSHLGAAATPRGKSGQDDWSSKTKTAAPPAKTNTQQVEGSHPAPQPRPAPKNTMMMAPKSEPKPAPRNTMMMAPKSEMKPAPRPEPHPMPSAHPAPRPAPRPENKPEPKPKK